MTQTLIQNGELPPVKSVDDVVNFEGGPSVRRRTIQIANGAPLVVIEPFLGVIEVGSRVHCGDQNAGIGQAIGSPNAPIMGLFYSIHGVDFVSSLREGARVLPDAIWVGVTDDSGSETYVDGTDAILDLPIEQIRTIRDGVLPDCLVQHVGFKPVRVDIAAAVSFYFGKMPTADHEGLKVAQDISDTDLIQSRYTNDGIAQERQHEEELAMAR